MNEWDVTVAVPTIPTPDRRLMLGRALASVMRQTHPAIAVSVAVDLRREGAWTTRQRALNAVRTPWTAFLDDDDELMPQHIEKLVACARETGADYAFSWYDLRYAAGGPLKRDGSPKRDPLGHFGRPFDPANPHHTTMTALVRTELALSVGFTPPPEGVENAVVGGEDWRFTLGCVDAGAKIVHLPERTWYYHGDRHSTSGLPTRWAY